MPPVIRLSNEISIQFAHKSHDEAVDAIAVHMNSFWDPRMRSQLVELAPLHRGDLDEIVFDVIPKLRVSAGA
jgi:formate dehydrogenase subunit delta